MGNVVQFARHARASSAVSGYRSGRSSWRDTPETLSTLSTRKGGTSTHWDTACGVTPIARAKAACPPVLSTARLSASVLSLIVRNSSIALYQSQALLCCFDQAELYNIEMTLGKRIKTARERLKPHLTQAAVGKHFGVSAQAVSGWERDDTVPDLNKIAPLARLLRVPAIWLLEGGSPVPAPDSIETTIEQLTPSQRAMLNAVARSILKETDEVA